MKHHKKDSDFTRRDRFEQLHLNYSRRIYNLVLNITKGNSYLAEEITQTVFLRLWENIDSIDENRNLRSYLFRIAKNTLLNYLKHQTIEFIYLNYISDDMQTDNNTQSAVDSSFLNQYILTLVSEMPEMRQKVFRLSRLHYHSNQQIPIELGISISTVETHLQLALRFLREELHRRYGL